MGRVVTAGIDISAHMECVLVDHTLGGSLCGRLALVVCGIDQPHGGTASDVGVQFIR